MYTKLDTKNFSSSKTTRYQLVITIYLFPRNKKVAMKFGMSEYLCLTLRCQTIKTKHYERTEKKSNQQID